MDFFVDDVPVYETFDTFDMVSPGVAYGGYDVIETVAPSFGFGIGIAPTVVVAPPVVTTTCTTVNQQPYGYGYRPPMGPVPMMSRNPYGMGGYGPYQQYPTRRFY